MARAGRRAGGAVPDLTAAATRRAQRERVRQRRRGGARHARGGGRGRREAARPRRARPRRRRARPARSARAGATSAWASASALLSRALLRRAAAAVDEATSAVDEETDRLIQATVSREFRESTLLTTRTASRPSSATTASSPDAGVVVEDGAPRAPRGPARAARAYAAHWRGLTVSQACEACARVDVVAFPPSPHPPPKKTGRCFEITAL